MEKSSFFNSVNGDRRYDATDWAEYFASFIGNGVFGNPPDCLQVVPDGAMRVALLPGAAWINGYFYASNARNSLALDNADGVLKRIDRIVIQWSLADRQISARVKKGAAAANPVAPVLQRDSSIYELCVADVLVNAGATSVVETNITDRRGDPVLCGKVISVVGEAHEHDLNTLNGPLGIPKGGTGAGDAGTARANLGAAAANHDHALSSLSGTLSVAKGGTGASDANTARANLGVTLGNLGAAAASHDHSLPALSGILSIAKGGTGATDANAARANLGVTLGNLGAAAASHDHSLSDLSGTLSIAKGGTGATSAASARNALGLGNTNGALPVANGGTGAASVEAARNALGLGYTSGALPIANGGTGATTAAAARYALGLGNTSGALPVANGGTGAVGAKEALSNLGIFYAASLPSSGTDGQICLVPIGG